MTCMENLKETVKNIFYTMRSKQTTGEIISYRRNKERTKADTLHFSEIQDETGRAFINDSFKEAIVTQASKCLNEADTTSFDMTDFKLQELDLDDDDANLDVESLSEDETTFIYGRNLVEQIDDANPISPLNVDGDKPVFKQPPIDEGIVSSQDEDGDTLLHLALICMSPELAFAIIDNAPNIKYLNIQNKLFQSPLHLAVLTNQIPLVKRLVVRGADLEARDYEGNMPIHLACRDNKQECLKALLQPVRYEEEIQSSCDVRFQAIPFHSKNYEGLTCLHVAALEGNLSVIQTLVKHGFNVDEKAGKSGRTILHEAAWTGNLQLVKYLISLGRQCDINARSYDGFTSFDLARSRGHWSIVLELATAGAKYEDETDMEI